MAHHKTRREAHQENERAKKEYHLLKKKIINNFNADLF